MEAPGQIAIVPSRMSLLTDTPLSTESPNANATATANNFDLTATQFALTATPVPTSGSLNATATQFARSATPIPAGIAALITQDFTLIDKSGNDLGSGQIRIYAPQHLVPDEQNQVRVEIETQPLSTPPNVTIVPPPSATPVLTIGTPAPSLTPLPLVGINFLDVHDYMLVDLQSIDPSRFTINPIPSSRTGVERLYKGVVNRWIWGIVPAKGVSGRSSFALSVELPRQRNDGTIVYDLAIDPIQFQISVDTAPATTIGSSGLLIGLVSLILIVGAIGLLLISRRSGEHPAAATTGTVLNATVSKYAGIGAFVSYRRAIDWATARQVRDILEGKGLDIFLDVHDLGEGDFEKRIKTAIAAREYFILVLSPSTVESVWVIKETLYARDSGRRIIPLLNQFDMYKDKLPAELEFLRALNAVTLSPEFFDAAIDRVLSFMEANSKNSSTPE